MEYAVMNLNLQARQYQSIVQVICRGWSLPGLHLRLLYIIKILSQSISLIEYAHRKDV